MQEVTLLAGGVRNRGFWVEGTLNPVEGKSSPPHPVIFLRVLGFLFTYCFLFRDVRCNWSVLGKEKSWCWAASARRRENESRGCQAARLRGPLSSPALHDSCPLLPAGTPALPSPASWVPSAYSAPGPCLFTADLLALWAWVSPPCRREPLVLGQSERSCVAPSTFGCKWPDEWPNHIVVL